MVDRIGGQERGEVVFRRVRIGDDPGLRVEQQPNLGKCLVTIAKNRHAFLRNAEEGRKDGQLFGHRVGI